MARARAPAFLVALGAACHLLGCGSDPGRPNVVLVVIDTLRADRLGAYGFPEASSPAFDALAARGVVFTHVLAPSSWTRTSIASLVTSLPPRSLGIFHEYRDALDDRFDTLAEVLWAGGYRTLGATANPNINTSYHFDQGFDAYADSDVIFPWMRPEPGKRSTERAPLPAGRDLYQSLLERLGQEDRRPFYVQVNVMEVHEHRLFENGAPEAGPALFSERDDAAYLRAVRRATDELADFVAAVSALPGGRNTLFVVTSDHGEGLGDHPREPKAAGHGFVLYASQLRVPLLLYHPGGALPRGRVVDTPVRLLDVMPTILDFAGLAGPAGMEGRSLLPLVRGDGDVALPEVFFAETHFQRRDKVAAYTSEWKYFENRESWWKQQRQTLHPAGVVEDGTRTDVSAEHPEVVAHLAAAVRAWEQSHPPGRPTPPARPPSSQELQQLRELGYLR
jgi:choline-sulfatase